MRRFRILIVLTPSFDPNAGGVQMTTYKLASYFSQNGHTVSIYSFRDTGHVQQEFGTLFCAPKAGSFQNPVNLDFMRWVVKSQAPEVVINQMPYDHAIGRVLLQEKRSFSYLLLGCLRNTLYSVRYNIDSYRRNVVPLLLQPLFKNRFGELILLEWHKRRHRKDLRAILDTYDFFVVFGPQNREEISYFVGNYKEEKVAFIPNSIPDVLTVVPAKEKIILFLGRLSVHQKRVDLLLPLWRKVKDQLPDWEFWIVGEGPEYGNLLAEILEERIPRVKLWGKQPPYEFYKRAAIFLMTSSYEGFPNVLVEAQSRACVPVVMNTYPIVNLIINDGENGFLIKPFDLDAMAARIVILTKSKELQRRVSEAALINATRFLIDKVGEEWQALFNAYHAENTCD